MRKGVKNVARSRCKNAATKNKQKHVVQVQKTDWLSRHIPDWDPIGCHTYDRMSITYNKKYEQQQKAQA